MNRNATIGIIVVLVLIGAVLGYAYVAAVGQEGSLKIANNNLDRQLSSLDSQVKGLELNYSSLQSSYSSLQRNVSNLNASILQLQSELSNNESNVVLSQAYEHWNSIAIENTSLFGSQYSTNATLEWIGGPLSGTYVGLNAISSTWNKFFSLWSAVWFYAESPPTVMNSKGTFTVNATVQWVLTSFGTPQQVNTISTNYTLEMRYFGGRPLITMEVLHIVGVGIISYPSSEVENLQTEALLNASFSHWNNIAIENLSLVMSQYTQNSSLQWIGGKLAGNYTNYTEIQSVWSKFFGLWNAVWFYSEAPPMVTVNYAQGSVTSGTVTADIQFVVQSSSNTSAFEYINVVYTLDFTVSNGNFTVSHEVFDNVGSGPLSQVAPFD